MVDVEDIKMNADGGKLKRLTRQAQAENVPAWSSDGKQIAFSTGLLGNRDIYVMNADGGNIRRLTQHPAKDGISAWFPNDRFIVFSAEWEENSDIYLIDVGGDNRRRLTHDPAVDKSPTWVPAGFSLPISPTEETQTTLWGRLKQSVRD